jgi:hypothetical protein
VYAVAYCVGKPARWPEASCGGWYRGNPAVPIDELDANWVEGAEIVYIGKADCTPSTDLRVRLRAFARFGAGARVSHWGGRLIWQLPEPASLRIGWLETGEADPLAVEAGLIAEFRAAFGKPPFANDPHRFGQ